MKRSLVFLTLIGVLCLAGCNAGSQQVNSRPTSPAAYGVQQENRDGREVWGITASDLAVAGLKQGDSLAKAQEVFGSPTKGGGNTYVWLRADGSRIDIVTKESGEIQSLGITGGTWQTRRGVHVGSTLAEIQQVYGPSHDSPDDAVYESQPGGPSISFMLDTGKVTGVLVGF